MERRTNARIETQNTTQQANIQKCISHRDPRGGEHEHQSTDGAPGGRDTKSQRALARKQEGAQRKMQQKTQCTAPRPRAPRGQTDTTAKPQVAPKEKEKGTKRAREQQHTTRPEATGRSGPEPQMKRRQSGQQKKKRENHTKASQLSPEGAKQIESAKRQATRKMGRTRKRLGGRPAQPGKDQESTHTHTHTHTHTERQDPGPAYSDPGMEVCACTRKSRGAPANNPVERRMVEETRRVSLGFPTQNHRSACSQRQSPEGPASGKPTPGRRTGTMRSEPSALAAGEC